MCPPAPPPVPKPPKPGIGSKLDDPFGSVAPAPPAPQEAEVIELADEDVILSVAPPPPPTVQGGKDAKVVLVVEDDPAIRMMIVKGLGLEYTVYEAVDGQAALDLLQKIPNPDAMVCDVMMPHVDGYELAKTIKKNASLRQIPIVFLTAKSSALDVVAGINAGARHYLSKPFKMKELIEKVGSVIGRPSANFKAR